MIRTRWVITNKGDAAKPDVRARLVACELNTYRSDEFFASTPPLEAKRLLFSEFACRRRDAKGIPLELSFLDIQKAYFGHLSMVYSCFRPFNFCHASNHPFCLVKHPPCPWSSTRLAA